MKKKYNHVYVEITNRCNFSCSFCPKTTRKLGKMSLVQFESICQQLQPLTDMIYLHVMGEPLLHEDFAKIVKMATQYGFKIGLTTNAVYLAQHASELYDTNLNRVHLSLHSYFDANNRVTNDQLEKTVAACDDLLEHTQATIIYRLWDMDHPEAVRTVEYLKEHYQCEDAIEMVKTNPNGVALRRRVRLQLEHVFTWPVRSTRDDEVGFCQGLRTHFAILCDGTVVPCCLDNEGTIALGNCLETPLEEILKGERAQKIYQQFTNRKIVEPLCKKCDYKTRFLPKM